MKVKLISRAPINGNIEPVGSVHDIDSEQALHWIRNGIAEAVPEKAAPKKKED